MSADAIILSCAACGRRNRVAVRHLAGAVRCGACRAALAPLAAPLDVDAAMFDVIVQHSAVPVLVDFWAAWCGPCRAAAPEVARTAADTAGRALVLKVDTERHPDLAARYQVSSIPNFVVIVRGEGVLQQPGVVSHVEMTRWLVGAA